jgi:hypothetical protein
MRGATGVYRNIVQQLVLEGGKQEVNGLLERISVSGFEFAQGQSMRHEELKTQAVWNEFLTLIATPELAPHSKNYVQLIDTTDWNSSKVNGWIDGIAEKYRDEKESTLSEDEKTFLLYLGYHKLSQGIMDTNEYFSFIIQARHIQEDDAHIFRQ